MTEDDLILRLATRLDSTDPVATAATLRSTETFSGDTSWLQRLFEGAQELPPVSDELRGRLDGLYTEHMMRGDPISVTAIAVHDSRRDGELVGVRTAHSDVTDAWSVVYSAPGADLIIDGRALSEGRTRLSGRLTGLPTEDDATYRISSQSLPHRIETDRFRRFTLGDFDDETHDFVVESDRYSLRWSITLGD